MKDEILTYREMCDQEKIQTLQRGMNFRLSANYSVILMSQRKNAPYRDRIFDDGFAIEYEGHDVPKTEDVKNPKEYDQPRYTKTGNLTQNGKFLDAVEKYKNGEREAEIVRVYEKLIDGVWSEKGFFRLVDCKRKKDDKNRYVFRFILEGTEIDMTDEKIYEDKLKPRSRIIPSEIKTEVWKRDKGRCVICGASDELHFDHNLPYSKGGTSISAENVRILCARHNLQKSNKIQ
jgi:hypothetical protein